MLTSGVCPNNDFGMKTYETNYRVAKGELPLADDPGVLALVVGRIETVGMGEDRGQRVSAVEALHDGLDSTFGTIEHDQPRKRRVGDRLQPAIQDGEFQPPASDPVEQQALMTFVIVGGGLFPRTALILRCPGWSRPGPAT